jgi:hypothetical protein
MQSGEKGTPIKKTTKHLAVLKKTTKFAIGTKDRSR